MWLFAPRKTPAEVLREHKRALDKSIRELDRERTALEQQEKKLIVEIKKMAKQNQISSVRVMAKDLIRIRHSITKFHGLKSQLQGVSLKMQTLKSTQAMAEAMRGVAKAMAGMNRQLNLPTLQATLREFEKQSERMDMTSEMMGDAVDDALEGEGDQEESEELVNQVLDEIGCNFSAQLVSAPGSTPAVGAPVAAQPQAIAEPMGAGGGGAGLDMDLQARLDNLRKM